MDQSSIAASGCRTGPRRQRRGGAARAPGAARVDVPDADQ